MKIGILGSGNMGRALGARWAEAGHEVFFGGRNLQKTRAVAALVGRNTRAGSLHDAAEFGEVLLHTARDAMPSAMVDNPAVLNGKILIDLNNGPIPEDFAYPPIERSFTERLADDSPQLQVVKAFNMFAMEMFEHDAYTISQHDVSAFIAGDSDAAKATVSRLAADLGLTPIDAGPTRNARQLEGMGDFIRYLMIEKKMGPFATISTHSLPMTDNRAFGGRQASNFR